MPALGHQRPEDTHQLAGIHIVHGNHFGDVFVAGRVPGQACDLILLGLHLRHDAHHAVTAAHRRKALRLEHPQKQVVQLLAPDRLAGNDIDLPTDPRIDDKVDAGFLADNLDQAIDVRVAQIQHQVLVPFRRLRR